MGTDGGVPLAPTSPPTGLEGSEQQEPFPDHLLSLRQVGHRQQRSRCHLPLPHPQPKLHLLPSPPSPSFQLQVLSHSSCSSSLPQTHQGFFCKSISQCYLHVNSSSQIFTIFTGEETWSRGTMIQPDPPPTRLNATLQKNSALSNGPRTSSKHSRT